MTNQGTNQENVQKQDLNKGQSNPSQGQDEEKRFSPDQQQTEKSGQTKEQQRSSDKDKSESGIKRQ